MATGWCVLYRRFWDRVLDALGKKILKRWNGNWFGRFAVD